MLVWKLWANLVGRGLNKATPGGGRISIVVEALIDTCMILNESLSMTLSRHNGIVIVNVVQACQGACSLERACEAERLCGCGRGGAAAAPVIAPIHESVSALTNLKNLRPLSIDI